MIGNGLCDDRALPLPYAREALLNLSLAIGSNSWMGSKVWACSRRRRAALFRNGMGAVPCCTIDDKSTFVGSLWSGHGASAATTTPR